MKRLTKPMEAILVRLLNGETLHYEQTLNGGYSIRSGPGTRYEPVHVSTAIGLFSRELLDSEAQGEWPIFRYDLSPEGRRVAREILDRRSA